jgi:hypothetical protein
MDCTNQMQQTKNSERQTGPITDVGVGNKKKPNRRERAIKRRERIALGLPAPLPTPPKIRPVPRLPTHGHIPDPSAGWVADKPMDEPMFRIVRVTTVRFDDGFVQKFYQMLMRTEELKRKRELAKHMLKKVRRENREAEHKQEKQRKRELRAVLALFGKS